MVYFDFSGLEQSDLEKHRRSLAKNRSIFFGALDPTQQITDVAELFHDGAVDYLGKAAIKEGISAKRIKKVRQYLERNRGDDLEQFETKPDAAQPFGESGEDWDKIVVGKEYTFCMMFIELDGAAEMEKKYGRKNLDIALSSFKQYIDISVKPFNGRIWIWSSFGGLVLFPLVPKKSDPVKCGFRIMLFKHLYDIEESVFPNFISLRIAVHIGRTVYTKINTGQIISDTLNSVFHLGQQHAKPGKFYMTEDVLRIRHPAFADYFVEDGTFEGRKIYRMRLALHSGSD